MIPVKMKKTITACLVTALILSLLTGCGTVKSAWIAARFATALKGNPITGTSGTMTADVTGKTLGVDSQAGLELEFSTVSDLDSQKSYGDIHSRVSMLGMNIPQDLQIYGLPEGESTVCYVHLAQPDLWARSALNWSPSFGKLLDPGFLVMLAERAAKDSELQEEGENYVLRMQFRPGDLLAMAEAAGGRLPAGIESLELSQISVPMTLTIDGKSFLPSAMTLQVSGLSGELLEAISKAAGRELKGTELEAGSLTLEIREFSFGEKTVPVLPEEAPAKAANMEELMGFLKKMLPD